MWNVPEILSTHAVQYEIDAEIRHEKLLSNTLSDNKIGRILDFVLDGGRRLERKEYIYLYNLFIFV